MRLTLHAFIDDNRGEIVRRCTVKAAAREGPPALQDSNTSGIPLFLDQLVSELGRAQSKRQEIRQGAVQHGHQLFLRGFTVAEVVHNYGDVCQSVTELALDLDAGIDTEDFRTLNRCLDDAIAAAVTAHARDHKSSHDVDTQELRSHVGAAITAFEVLQSGYVGIGGSTGAIVHRSLVALRELIDQPVAARSETDPEPRTELDPQPVGRAVAASVDGPGGASRGSSSSPSR